jgi:dephospho-CoA kinase
VTIRLGLTGNIGCGKSAVGAMLRELGAEYVDADAIVHQLLASRQTVAEAVINRFGESMRAADGGVDRRALGRLVFGNPDLLRELEAIVVPGVRTEIRRRLAESSAPVIVVDAIKLIESGLARELDRLWVVACDPAEQRQRLIELRGMTPDEAQARIGAQPPQVEKIRLADVVIDNSGSLEATRAQVVAAWDHLTGNMVG